MKQHLLYMEYRYMYMHYILHLNKKKKTRIVTSTEMTNAPEPSISCTIFVYFQWLM